MDILSFLNSNDVAKYLKEINYSLSPIEIAYIVYHSNHHTLAQKREAWEYISKTYPDAVYGKAAIGIKKKPLGEHIKNYLALLDEFIKECKAQDNAVWDYAYKTDECGKWDSYFCNSDNVAYFSSFDRCFDYVYTEAEKHCIGNLKRVRIIKSYLDSDKRIFLDFDEHKNLLEVDAEALSSKDLVLLWLFSEMWISIPTPFNRGDMVAVTNKETGEKDAFVLSTICTWGAEELKKNGFKNGKFNGRDSKDFNFIESNFKNLRREGDETCMCFDGYLFLDGDLDYCNSDNYLDLEYYHGEDDYDYKLLKVFSEYVKGNVEVHALLKFYKYFTLKSETFFAKHEAWLDGINYDCDLKLNDLLKDKKG